MNVPHLSPREPDKRATAMPHRTGDRRARRPQSATHRRADLPRLERGAADGWTLRVSSTEGFLALASPAGEPEVGAVGRWTALSVSSEFMDAALIFLTQSDGPNPIRPETNEMVWGFLSIGLLVLPVVVAALVVAYLVSALRQGE